MLIQIDRSAPVPIHDQIKEQIVGLIQAGRLKTGDQLPTMRALSADLEVNFNTVAHAYRELDAQGIIHIRRGEGTFVASTPSEDEMRRLREARLERLARELVHEARRLGFTPDDVRQTLARLLAPWEKET
jgi:GntR family transcriptional regulator